MKIRRLTIQNFRGIRELDWKLSSSLTCLVGAGDSTKSTILEALGLVLSRSYAPQFTDADFFDCDTSRYIDIQATVAELPNELIRLDRFGRLISGINDEGDVVPDLMEGYEECLVVRLKVDGSLEPEWDVIRLGNSEPARISANLRRLFAFYRLGEQPDLHLRWSRQSALTAMTEQRDTAPNIILDAHRAARESIFKDPPETLKPVSQAVHEQSTNLGSGHNTKLRPGLDPFGLSTGSALSLHDGDIPLSRFGTGTRRIMALSIQEMTTDQGAILAIDEIEFGLEPHRLSHLISHLKERLKEGKGQAIITTHSPVAVATLSAQDLCVVQCKGGVTQVKQVPAKINEVQGTIRAAPSALLARRVVVGEGSTEVGMIRGLAPWIDIKTPPSAAARGLGIANGGGANCAERAKVFADLGYDVLLIADNDDRSIDNAIREAQAAGVKVIRCSESKCIEEEMIYGFDYTLLENFVAFARKFYEDTSLLDRINAHLSHGKRLSHLESTNWNSTGVSWLEVRDAIAKSVAGRKADGAMGKNAWFKSESGGIELATFVITNWPDLSGTDFGRLILEIEKWIHSSESSHSQANIGHADE